MNKTLKLNLKMLVFALFLVVIDQISKYVAIIALKGKNDFHIIKDVLLLHYLDGGNRGAAWGMFSGKILMFIIFTLIAIFFNTPKISVNCKRINSTSSSSTILKISFLVYLLMMTSLFLPFLTALFSVTKLFLSYNIYRDFVQSSIQYNALRRIYETKNRNQLYFLIPVLLFYLRFFVFTCIFQYFYTLHSPAESYPL